METMLRVVAGDLHLRSGDDGPVVEGLVVPYDTPADVYDVGTDERYVEVFTRSSWAGWLQRAAGAAHRVRFNLDHSEAFDDRIGYGRAFSDDADGLRGQFHLYRDPTRLDKVRDMLATSHGGLSIEFAARRYRTRLDGAREWIGAQLAAVAATPAPQHPGARVLAVRAERPGDLDAPHTPRLDAALADPWWTR